MLDIICVTQSVWLSLKELITHSLSFFTLQTEGSLIAAASTDEDSSHFNQSSLGSLSDFCHTIMWHSIELELSLIETLNKTIISFFFAFSFLFCFLTISRHEMTVCFRFSLPHCLRKLALYSNRI